MISDQLAIPKALPRWFARNKSMTNEKSMIFYRNYVSSANTQILNLSNQTRVRNPNEIVVGN